MFIAIKEDSGPLLWNIFTWVLKQRYSTIIFSVADTCLLNTTLLRSSIYRTDRSLGERWSQWGKGLEAQSWLSFTLSLPHTSPTLCCSTSSISLEPSSLRSTIKTTVLEENKKAFGTLLTTSVRHLVSTIQESRLAHSSHSVSFTFVPLVSI